MDYLFNKKVSCRRFHSAIKQQREEMDATLNARLKSEAHKIESVVATNELATSITESA
jgi:hypothetical protein